MESNNTIVAGASELSFKIIPLQEAKGFTNREIPDFINAERGPQMKKLWNDINGVGEVNDLIAGITKDLEPKTYYQHLVDDNVQRIELDQAPDILREMLGEGKVVCEFDMMRFKDYGSLFGRVVFRSEDLVGAAQVTKEVAVETRINKVYELEYHEHAVIGQYEADRKTNFVRGDINDNSLYYIDDDKTIIYPSNSEVDVYTAQEGNWKNFSLTPFDEKLTWIKESRPGQKVIGATFHGNEPVYRDTLVPKLTDSERKSYSYIDSSHVKSDNTTFDKLFPIDRSLF